MRNSGKKHQEYRSQKLIVQKQPKFRYIFGALATPPPTH